MHYNKKINYQFCKNIVIGSTDEKEQELRRVFNQVDEPTSEMDFKLLKCKEWLDALHMSKNFVKTLVHIHEEMYEVKPSSAEITLIEKVLNGINEELVYQRLAETCLFDNRIDFLAFVYTAKRISAFLPPVIFYKDSTQLMYSFFRVGNTTAGSAVFAQMKKKTDFQNQSHSMVGREEIVKKILEAQNRLRKLFSINTIYLYGSCARDEMDEYSDIDLICLIDYEDKFRLAKAISEIHEFFDKLLDLPIDLKIGCDENDPGINANIRRDLYKIY